MKQKNIKRKVILTILLLNLIIVSGDIVRASKNEVKVFLPVQQIFELKSKREDNLNLIGTYELNGLNNVTPMPEGSNENDGYTFTMDGENDENEIPILFDRGGIYQYRLWQTTKDRENYIYDRSSYIITVYIKNGADDQLSSEVIVENGSGKKCQEISFKNSYKENSKTQTKDPVQTDGHRHMEIWLMFWASAVLLVILVGKKIYK